MRLTMMTLKTSSETRGEGSPFLGLVWAYMIFTLRGRERREGQDAGEGKGQSLTERSESPRWLAGLRLGEGLEGALVEVGDCNSGSEGGIVRMGGGESGSCLCGEFVELRGRHALVDTSSDLLGHENLRLMRRGER